MSKKDPAFLFYSKDWIEGTAEMMPDEKGVYIDLLAYQHQRGYLPSETKRLARLVRMSVEEFENVWNHISDKFEQDGERTLNRKLQQVMDERSDKGETNKIIGIFGNLCRTSTRSRSDINKIRKQFKASIFKGVDSERLSELITEWFDKRLAALEDANEDEDLNETDSKEHKLLTWISENAPSVNKLKEPLTVEQCDKLINDFDKEYIRDMLTSMHNYEPLLKNNRSANLTFRKWSNRDKNYEKWLADKGRVEIKMNT